MTLEERVRSAPDDLDAWAVLADELQELGDPVGDLIALDLRGEPAPPELRAALFVDCPAAEIRWRHGAPYAANAKTADLAKLGACAASRFLRELDLFGGGDHVAAALDDGAFDGLRHFTFNAFESVDDEHPAKLEVEGVRTLLGSERLRTQIEHLSLGGQRLRNRGLELMAEHRFERLTSLKLTANGITILNPLLGMRGLKALNLHGNMVADAGFETLAALDGLTSLTVGMSGVSEGLGILAHASTFASIESFTCFMDAPSRDSVLTLLRSPNTRALTELCLASCDLEDDSVEALCEGLLGQLSVLEIQSNKLTDESVKLLVSQPTHLKTLNLEFNELTEASLEMLASCSYLTTLEQLWLWTDTSFERGIRALLESPHLSTIAKSYLAWQFGLGPDPSPV